jgi:hypothetical protein
LRTKRNLPFLTSCLIGFKSSSLEIWVLFSSQESILLHTYCLCIGVYQVGVIYTSNFPLDHRGISTIILNKVFCSLQQYQLISDLDRINIILCIERNIMERGHRNTVLLNEDTVLYHKNQHRFSQLDKNHVPKVFGCPIFRVV